MKDLVIKLRWLFPVLAVASIFFAPVIYGVVFIDGWFSFIGQSFIGVVLLAVLPIFIFVSLGVKGFEWEGARKMEILRNQGVLSPKNPNSKFIKIILHGILIFFLVGVLIAISLP